MRALGASSPLKPREQPLHQDAEIGAAERARGRRAAALYSEGMPDLVDRRRNSLRARPWHAGAQLPAPRPAVRLIMCPPPSRRRVRARLRGLRLALLHTGPLIHEFQSEGVQVPTNLKAVAIWFNFRTGRTQGRRSCLSASDESPTTAGPIFQIPLAATIQLAPCWNW